MLPAFLRALIGVVRREPPASLGVLDGFGRIRIGQVWIDEVSFGQALERIEALVRAGHGGSIFTPNVDHVVNADYDPDFRAAYGRASLSLVDGQPVRWASALLGTKLPEKVSGSDLVDPLVKLAVEKGFRVYLLGGMPGVAEQAAVLLRQVYGANVVGVDAPRVSLTRDPGEAAIVERIRQARPDLLLVALGAPKQELFIDRNREALAPAVAIAIGAGLDFLTGRLRRAPRWMQRAGLEWLFRLAQEPWRLGHRYLIRDPRFLGILLRTMREPRGTRLARADVPRPPGPVDSRFGKKEG